MSGAECIDVDPGKTYEKFVVNGIHMLPDNTSLPELQIFYGFSGPAERVGSFEFWAQCVAYQLGYRAVVIMADILNGIDLADDTNWAKHRRKLGPGGGTDGSLWSPTCSTFSRARTEGDGGPRPLRGPHVPDLLGLPGLEPAEKEKVRLGTLLGNRAADGISAQNQASAPWILENPPEYDEFPSLFRLPAMVETLAERPVHAHVFPQCIFDAMGVKMTEFRACFKMKYMPEKSCPHQRVWWRQLPLGRWIRASHPPLRGKYRAVTPDVYDRMTLKERSTPEQEFLTRASAAYPSRLNCFLACQLIPRAVAAKASRALNRTGEWMNKLVRQSVIPRSVRNMPIWDGAGLGQQALHSVAIEDCIAPRRRPIMVDPLRTQPCSKKLKENEIAIGGMRRPQWAVSRLPTVAEFGLKMRELIFNILDEDDRLEQQCLAGIGSDDPEAGPSEGQLAVLRSSLGRLLDTDDVEPYTKSELSTEICVGLLEAWRAKAGDPDWAVTQWLGKTGVPAGLRNRPQNCGIFPPAETTPDCAPEELRSADDFTPYASVEADDEAHEEINKFAENGWLKSFDKFEDVVAFLGERPVLSKFGLVIRIRAGKRKARIILDSKSSGVSDTSAKSERIILPKLLDVVYDILNLLATGQEIELFVIDFSNAFWLLPLPVNERKFFVSVHRGRYYVYLRNAQGSRGAPLGWGRTAALLGRLTQSMFHKNEARIEIYTDDPCITLAGSRRQRDRCVAAIVLIWRLLGFPLSWRKASRGVSISWIGGQFDVDNVNRSVSVKIKDDVFTDARDSVHKMAQANVVPIKELRSGTGKLSNIANLLTVWRPFMTPIYGALYGPMATGAPRNCIWTKQIATPLRWFIAFFEGSGGFIQRQFDLDFFRPGLSDVEIVIDASPWGLAGILLLDGHPVEYFHDAINDMDTEKFNYDIGSPDGQQVWESLAALIAVKLWQPHWAKRTTKLRLKGDSMTMLSLVVNLRPSTPQLAIIGQEMALAFASAAIPPVIAQHIPGVANVMADTLSRQHQPGKAGPLPQLLRQARAREVPARDDSYYMLIDKFAVPNSRE